jgi:hypothetical protein
MIRNNPEFDQRIADWLESDPNVAPPDVIATVVAAVPSISQARRGLLAPRRYTFMHSYLRLAAVVAVLALAGVGALTYFGGQNNVGPTQSATPTPTAVPTAAPPTATTSPTAGTLRMHVQGDAASWTAVVPPGWSRGGPNFVAPSQGPAGPTGIGVAATGAVNVPTDPCDGRGTVSDAASPADVVAALQARADLTVSTPTETTLGGYPGLQVDVEVPADLGACGTDNYIIFAEPDGSGFYAQGPSNQLRIWVVDIDGRPVVFFVESFATTPAAEVAAARQIVDSIVITP